MAEIHMRAYEHGEKSVDFMLEHNLKHAKTVIDNEEKFSPSLFVITKDTLYYVLLDNTYAYETKSSPMDQVEPLIRGFQRDAEKMGKIETYQVIGEGWMKKMSTKTEGLDKMRYGDISKMAGRIEVLMQIIGNNKEIKFSTFEMIRKNDSDKVIDYKEMDTQDGHVESGKFPVL